MTLTRSPLPFPSSLTPPGAAYVCPGCGNLADSQAGCLPCDEAYWEDQAGKHGAQELDQAAFRFHVNESEFRNFIGEGVN